MAEGSPSWRHRGYAFLDRIGVRPMGSAAQGALDAAFAGLARAEPDRLPVVLDAGCGMKSPLVPFRDRIGRLSGVDIHRPLRMPAYLDDFAEVDLCRPAGRLAAGGYDLVLSNFTVEHFAQPGAAFRTMHDALRPGGVVVVSTVNRRHPFVAAYLALPPVLRDRMQPLVKAGGTHVHPVIGACNDPVCIRQGLRDAGFEDVRLEMVSNLAHAWSGRLLPFLAGIIGDLLCHTMPMRRSTIVATARKPGGGDAS